MIDDREIQLTIREKMAKDQASMERQEAARNRILAIVGRLHREKRISDAMRLSLEIRILELDREALVELEGDLL